MNGLGAGDSGGRAAGGGFGAGGGAAAGGGSAAARAATARRDAAVRAAVRRGLVGPGEPVVGLLDLTGIRTAVAALRTAFDEVVAPGTPLLHAFAVKASPLVPVVRLLHGLGMGVEVASPGELALARAAGVPPHSTVLDSPAKTPAELREALAVGIAVNADNPQELARIDALMASAPSASPLGIRVNPQVGAGSIGALSTATATSKFGVGLGDEGAREWLVRAFLDRPWLTRLHTHTGSQGVALGRMARGVALTYELAEEINARAGRPQVDTVDIGGGLPVNFASEEHTPDFAAYARLLAREVPGLLDGRYGLVTEFGRSVLAKHGTVLARVEYTKTSGGRPIAVTHAGAQVAARTVYAPESWPLRIAAYDGNGEPRTGPGVRQDVAGPACFAGDLLATDRELPRFEPGDYAAALDTGAYYFAHHYAYNSLPRPAVWAYTVNGADGADGADGDGVRFAPVRKAQTTAEILTESGADLPALG